MIIYPLERERERERERINVQQLLKTIFVIAILILNVLSDQNFKCNIKDLQNNESNLRAF